ncbi:uncharacterized protein LOC127772728 [Oryza glaberrima]|uniref:uncharacterized protein LOC127772728 n=1 Tax=Oryza glaberrima TaxID=4538 RepID=UPI00224C0C99|nr:uncharacterized protein LOC127772728 [Oryza glaberrima]
MKRTWANLVQLWSGWEIQLMILLSLFLQLFLFFTGGLRRRRTNKLILIFIWLAYVGADLVAVYALGLLSRYEYKSKIGSDSLTVIWIPFLLVHLGGQDTITAFSIEDNNLWLRHLLNLIVQVSLALYAFCNSLGHISLQLVVPAIFIFVAGIIKYGERTWALKCGSLDGLQSSAGGYKDKEQEEQKDNKYGSYLSKVFYPHQMVLYARGLFAGVTVSQLGQKVRKELTHGIRGCENYVKAKIVELELSMMYDILYTKATILQTWIGCILRCISHIAMVVAFVLFLVTPKHGHRMADVAITYTLFAGALLMEACAIGVVAASPLTWARWRRHNCVGLLPVGKIIGAKEERSVVPICLGQFSLATCALHDGSTPRIMSRVLYAFGLEKIYRDVRHVKHVDATGIVGCFVDCFNNRPSNNDQDEVIMGVSKEGNVDVRLNLLSLSQRFEVGIIQLHLFTDILASSVLLSGFPISGSMEQMSGFPISGSMEQMTVVARECEKLSNYMMYLLVAHPSMLPVSSDYAVMEHLSYMAKLVDTNKDASDKQGPLARMELLLKALEHMTSKTNSDLIAVAKDHIEVFRVWTEGHTGSLNWPLQVNDILFQLVKETWILLLIYAASKSRGELHARRLGDGWELLTFIWLLLVHHGLGNVAEFGLTLGRYVTMEAPPSTIEMINDRFPSVEVGNTVDF